MLSYACIKKNSVPDQQVFGPPRFGSVNICTELDPSINKQKNVFKSWFLQVPVGIKTSKYLVIIKDLCEHIYSKLYKQKSILEVTEDRSRIRIRIRNKRIRIRNTDKNSYM